MILHLGGLDNVLVQNIVQCGTIFIKSTHVHILNITDLLLTVNNFWQFTENVALDSRVLTNIMINSCPVS